MIVKPKECVTM